MKKADREAILAALWHMGDLANDADDSDPDNYYSGVSSGIGRAMDLIEAWPIDDEEGA